MKPHSFLCLPLRPGCTVAGRARWEVGGERCEILGRVGGVVRWGDGVEGGGRGGGGGGGVMTCRGGAVLVADLVTQLPELVNLATREAAAREI